MVDTIFRIGHWSTRVAEAWHQDKTTRTIAQLTDGRTSCSRAAIAKRIRHRVQYEIQRRVKYDHSWVRPAICGQCWCTTQEFCVKCYICKVDVCGGCAVTGHILCKKCVSNGLCHQIQEREAATASWHYLPPASLQSEGPGDCCASCEMRCESLTQVEQRLLQCIECSRWLCKMCRLPQNVGRCRTCPAEQARSGGHWGISLRKIDKAPKE